MHEPQARSRRTAAASVEANPGRKLWYVGDTVDDARCARAAGVPFIGIAAPANPRYDRTGLPASRRKAPYAVLDDINYLEEVLRRMRTATIQRDTKETQIRGKLKIEGRGTLRDLHRHPLLRSHAGAVHQARRLRPEAERRWRSRRRPAPHRGRRRHRARPVVRQGAGRSQGHQSRGLFRAADGRDAGRGRGRSRRPPRAGLQGSGEGAAGRRSADGAGGGFLRRLRAITPAPTCTPRCCTAARTTTRSKPSSNASRAPCSTPAPRTRA